MARNSVGTVRPGSRRAGEIGRHGDDHFVVGAERDGVIAEVERRGAEPVKFDAMQFVPELHIGALRLEIGKAGIDKGGRQPLHGDQRPAGAAAGCDRLAQQRGGQPRRGFRRRVVEGRQEKRLDQPLVQRARAVDHVADGLAAGQHHQPRQHQIVAHAGVRHAAAVVEDPPREKAVAEPQGPALPAGEIDEMKVGFVRPAHAVRRADQRQIGEGAAVARQDDVVAVVDLHVEHGVDVGAAAAAGLRARLVQHHALARLRQPRGGGKSGETGADDVDGARRHAT